MRAISESYFPVSEVEQRIVKEERLVFASSIFFLFGSLLFGLFYTAANPSSLERSIFSIVPDRSANAVYPVLMEQRHQSPVNDAKPALSRENSGASGGITERKGFHTLSSYDTLSLPRPGVSGERGNNGQASRNAPEMAEQNQRESGEQSTDQSKVGNEKYIDKKRQNVNERQQRTVATQSEAMRGTPEDLAQGSEQKIPANYAFRKDFALRYDESSTLTIATRELEGFDYFINMMRTIRDTFAPPGINYAYRDFAGMVVNQPIKPQVVMVQFFLSDQGDVTDVRIVSSMGQRAVDNACLEVLQGKNFGSPPPEIFKMGHIFGINFVFPSVMRSE